MSKTFNELEKNKEIAGGKIIENKHAYAILAYMQIVPGHMLVIPKREVENIDELNNEELKSILELIKKIKIILKKTFGATGFNLAWNEGLVAGQTVPHFHLHIVPRKEGDKGILGYDPRKFLYRPGERDVTPKDELEKIAKMIKENLD